MKFNSNTKYLFFLMLLLFGVVVSGQDKPTKPDLTGHWILDEKKSQISDGFWNSELEIVHKEPELKIVFSGTLKKEKKTTAAIFYTDRRGEKTFPYFYYPDENVDSVTYWKGNSLRREYSKSQISDLSKVVNNNSKARGRTNIYTVETYSISKDGRKLTLTVDRMSQIYISPVFPIEGRVLQKFIFMKQ